MGNIAPAKNKTPPLKQLQNLENTFKALAKHGRQRKGIIL